MKTQTSFLRKRFIVPLVCVCLFGIAQHQPLFARLGFSSQTNSVGIGPTCVATADVNGDGRLDLITANYTGSTLTILTNNGTGVFGSNATLNVKIHATWVTAADIRGNGVVDLICANYTNSLTIFTNNGSGIFSSNTSITVGFGPYCVVATDLKGTGNLDLAVANQGTNNDGNTLTVLTNKGNGTFVLDTTLTTGTAPRRVTAVDTIGNGKPYLVTADLISSTLSVFSNRSNGRFSANIGMSSVKSNPNAIVASDINGDGKMDLLSSAAGSSGGVMLFTNNGQGGFQSGATFTFSGIFSGPGLTTSVAAADLDGNGNQDLICCNYTNVGYGVGALVILTNNNSHQLGFNLTNFVGHGADYVTTADVNADGKPDIIVANGDEATLTVLINTNAFPPPVSTPVLQLSQQSSFQKISWPSASPGWSLQEVADLTKTNWLASGYAGFPIADDGTNKSFTISHATNRRFYRLIHP